jgi:acetamidase/formamidase
MIHISHNTSTYTFSPHHPPALRVDPGTTILFETRDALDDQIQAIQIQPRRSTWTT